MATIMIVVVDIGNMTRLTRMTNESVNWVIKLALIYQPWFVRLNLQLHIC